jgi:hypothetical protein
MSSGRIDFGEKLLDLGTNSGYSQKVTILKPLSELFKLNYKELQMQFSNQRIEEEYGDQPFFNEIILKMTTKTNI